jgi:oxygen tolerance protein BatD
VRCAAVAMSLVFASSAFAADEKDRVFVELDAPAGTVFVQQRLPIRLRVGFDRDWFSEHVVSRHRRPMDVPIQIAAPWLSALEQTVVVAPSVRSQIRPTVAVGDEVVAVDRGEDVVRDGRTYTVLEVTRDVFALRSGDLALAAPTVRFTVASAFEGDALGSRVAKDVHDVIAAGPPRTLRISSLPDEGRPAEFCGAVGRFAVEASSDRRELHAGESVKLTLRIEGDGNLSLFAPPRLEGLAGFHVLGVLDAKAPDARILTYDLGPRDASVTEIPAVAFAFFDPTAPAAYRTVTTSPIPLSVRGVAERAPQPAPKPPSPDEHRSRSTADWIVPATAAALLAAIALLVVRRRAARRCIDPATVRAEAAAATFRRDVDADPASALVAYLAARLRCEEAAVISPDLSRRLVAAGVGEDLARRTAALVERLVATRFGGAAALDDLRSARDVVDALEPVFAR